MNKDHIFLKCVSVDIEVLTVESRMPTPDKNPILLVSCSFNYDYQEEDIKVRNVILLLHRTKEYVEKLENKIVYIFNDELKLLNKLLSILKENDVVTGYNVVGFDLVYIIDRCKNLGIRFINVGLSDKNLYYRKSLSKGFSVTKLGNLTGKIVIDVLAVLRREDEANPLKKKYNLKNLKLEHVSREILGIEKLEFSIKEMNNYWNDCDNLELRNRFIDYCGRDSELALMFLTKFRLLDKFIAVSKASGKLLQEVINALGSGGFVENLLLKEFRKYDRVMPIRSSYGSYKGEDELEGAFVLEPKLGVTDNIGSCDYASLYPTILIKYNLCYSTLVIEKDISKIGLTENDVEMMYDDMGNSIAMFVRKEKYKGIIPHKLEELLTLRAFQKKEMNKYEKETPEYMMYDSSQQGTKIMMNSFYGYTGDTDAKVYSWFIAASVTGNGRRQIKTTIKMIKDIKIEKNNNKYILEVISGDTDSQYIHVIKEGSGNVSREEVIYCVNYAADKVNEVLERPMRLAYENYIRRIVIVAKKHYAMLTIDDNGKESITSKGLETVRRDWCNYSTDTMAKIIDFILKESKIEDGIKNSVELIKERAKLLNDGKIDLNDLVLSKKLTKPITSYDNKAVHVQVAIKMKERGRPSEIGDRVQYIIINNGKKLVSEKAEEADYVMKNIDMFKIDKEFYIYHQLIPPAMRVLSLLGIKEETIASSLIPGQRSLFEF